MSITEGRTAAEGLEDFKEKFWEFYKAGRQWFHISLAGCGLSVTVGYKADKRSTNLSSHIAFDVDCDIVT